MGLLDSLMGNASEVNLEELAAELAPIMADGESLSLAYKVIRDMFVFTNKRLILIDKQGVTGKKSVIIQCHTSRSPTLKWKPRVPSIWTRS